jgi:putative transcriptional regulator
VREFEAQFSSLSGSLLLAHPSLRDPNFMNTVLFLSMHEEADGAFGMVLNRPSGRRLNELMPDRDLGMLAMAPVYLGGPVGQDQILLAAFRWDEITGMWNWRHDLTFESAPEMLEEEGTILRVFAGYSGWSKGQLEKELRHNTWVVHTPDASLLDPDSNGLEVWRSLVRSHGPMLRFLTDMPDNLGLN